MSDIDSRLRRWARGLEMVALLMVFLLPLLTAWLWWHVDSWREWHLSLPAAFQIAGVAPEQLSPSQRLMGFMSNMPALAAGCLVFFTLARICHWYRQGELFSARVAQAYRRFALGMLAWALGEVLAGTLLVLALTLDKPEGQRLLSIGIGGDVMAMVLVGLAIHLLGQVMEAGRRLQEEHALIL